MEDRLIINDSSFRKNVLKRFYKVDVFAENLGEPVLSYSGLSVFDVQEFLVFVDSKCHIKITCDL